MQIPLVDLKAQYKTVKSEVDSAISSVISNAAFIGGERLKSFERAFAQSQGAKHCIGVANGTDALFISMKMLGIGRGDEVITVANSWISTSETISQTGATPVFVDIDKFFNIDTRLIPDVISKRTKAILPVHLYGQPSNIEDIVQICDDHNLQLVEDCAQAHLARYAGKCVGNFGIAGTFSFFPGKNLGAYGDAGAIITNDKYFADKCQMFANHGALKKHEHQIEGINSRLDTIQAAILSVKLKYLDEWTRQRQRIADEYSERLTGIDDFQLPEIAPGRTHVFHLYVVRCSRRDELREHLRNEGIQTGVHYPTPLPLLRPYKYLGQSAKQFPRSVKCQAEILSLPMYPELELAQIDYVTSTIRKFYNA